MKKYTLLILVLSLTHFTWAQGITMTCEVKKPTITLDEELIISYTITGGKEITRLDIPENFSFQITNEFQSHRTVYVNNNQPVLTFTKTFTLQPLITGSFVFPKAQAVVDGFTVNSQPVKVTVLRGNNKSNNNRNALTVPVSLLNANESADKKVNDNIEVVQTINKNTCYVGENILSTIRLYSRLQAKYNISKLSAYNGFSIEDQFTNYRLDPELVQYKGKDYSMNEIRAVHLFPLKVGDLTVDPLSIEASVPLQRKINEQNFENFIHNTTLVSNQLNIKVLPLPAEGKPAGFNGAVGKFEIEAFIDKNTLHAEDLHQLEVTIKGEGNLPLIHLPKWQVPDEISLSQTTVQTDYIKDAYPFHGVKKFVIPFYAKKEGKVVLPAIHFSYFDPAKKQYFQISTQPLELNILAATLQNRRSVEELDKGFNTWWALLLIPVAAGGLFFFLRKRTADKKKVSPVTTTQPLKLEKRSRIVFDTVKKSYWENDYQNFYKHLQDYIVTVIEEKDQAKILNQRSLDNYLPQSSFTALQKEQIQHLYAKAQINRFSQLANPSDHSQDFQTFEKLAQSL